MFDCFSTPQSSITNHCPRERSTRCLTRQRTRRNHSGAADATADRRAAGKGSHPGSNVLRSANLVQGPSQCNLRRRFAPQQRNPSVGNDAGAVDHIEYCEYRLIFEVRLRVSFRCTLMSFCRFVCSLCINFSCLCFVPFLHASS